MMRLGVIAVGLILVAQIDGTAKPVRCWAIEGVALKPGDRGPATGPYWLSHSILLDGWLMFQPVLKGDTNAAARAMGFKSAKECGL